MSNDKSGKQKQKVRCIVHYFQRISSDMPKGNVSFERKVLPFENDSIHISYPDTSFWSTSAVPLCSFKVVEGNYFNCQKNYFFFIVFPVTYSIWFVIVNTFAVWYSIGSQFREHRRSIR